MHHEEMKVENLFGQRFYKDKERGGSKKVKNIYLNSTVANTDRPIISKTNCIERNLNDAKSLFGNNKESGVDKFLARHPIGHAKNGLLKTKVHVLNTTRNIGFCCLLLNITYAFILNVFPTKTYACSLNVVLGSKVRCASKNNIHN